MIQKFSRLKVADNSGAREIMCVRVINQNAKIAHGEQSRCTATGG